MAEPVLTAYVADKEVRDRLLRLQRKTGNLEPAFKNIGSYLLLSTDDRFRKEVDPQGNPWKPNAPSTIAQKKAQGRINKILQNTGRLRDGFSYKTSRDRVTIGTNVNYASKHQLGQGVPKREFLGVSKEDEREIIAILDEFLTES